MERVIFILCYNIEHQSQVGSPSIHILEDAVSNFGQDISITGTFIVVAVSRLELLNI